MAASPPKSAVTPSAKVAPDNSNAPPITGDKGKASGVTTDTRVMTAAGPANLPFALITRADPASVENLRRYEEDQEALTNADESGIQIARKHKTMRAREKNAADSTVEIGCKGSLDIYTGTSNQGGLKGDQVGTWVCGLDEEIKFREEKYQVQQEEFRLFIEGADVTHYVEGAISWTLESTGGMNSCRFTLNNTQDAFILTPENICAGLNPDGWRVSGLGQGAIKYRAKPERATWRVDETAKFIIYYNKYTAVGPESTTPQIDQETGMWLFPLNPYSCIFNLHDCVRLFVRLPHVSGVRSPSKRFYDMWMPAFTGFIKDFNWDDDPVMGARYVRITCYDYRGILERMRVAIGGAGVPSGNSEGGAKNPSTGKPGDPPKPGEQSKDGDQGKETDSEGYLRKAQQLGRAWYAWYGKQGLKFPNGVSFSAAGGDPYVWAQKAQLIQAFKQLYNYALGNQIAVRKLNSEPPRAGTQEVGEVVAGKQVNPSDPKMIDARRAANDEVEAMVCNAVEGIGQTMYLAAQIYKGTGVVYDVKATGALPAPGAPPTFDTSLATASPDFKPTPGSADQEMFRQKARTELIKAYDQYIGGSARGALSAAPLSISGQSTNPVTKKTIPFPATIVDLVYQYFDINLRGKPASQRTGASGFRDSSGKVTINDSEYNFPTISSLIVKIQNHYSALIRAYDSASVNAGTRVTAYPPLIELLSTQHDLLSPEKKARYVGNTVEQRVLSATQQYISSLIASVAASRKALADEQARVTTPSTDKLSQALLYMARNRYTSSPDYMYIVTFAQNIGFAGSYEQWPLNYTSFQIGQASLKYEASIKRALPSSGDKVVTQLRKAAEKVQEMRRNSTTPGQQGGTQINTMGAILTRFVEFDKAKVGIFGDLIVQLEQGHPHPLAGKTFEESIEFLCTSNSEVVCGTKSNAASYAASALDKWNRLVLFGAVQRPLTYAEMQAVGEGTIRSFESDFCPLKAFYHILLPEKGVGVKTAVKMNIGMSTASTPGEPTFTTRLQLLNEVCESLDYQFFVSGMGDMVFELPVYNSYPDTFGPVFAGAYQISRDWISSSISEESLNTPTAWTVSGQEPDLRLQKSTDNIKGGQNFNKVVIMNNVMTRRLGVKVESIPLKIPGVGALQGGSPDAMRMLATYAAFYIQRQLARAHTLSVKYPFRPYVVPNRPLWLIPRQRIGLTMNVTHTMTPPGGACTTDSTIGSVRWMFRDGTFRFIGGGDRQPMDYIGFFSGVASSAWAEGPPASGPLSLASIGRRFPGDSSQTPSDLANRIRAANAFSANIEAAYTEIDTPLTDQAVQQMVGRVVGATDAANAAGFAAMAQAQKKPGVAGTKPVTAAPVSTNTATQGATNTAAQNNYRSARATQRVRRAQRPTSRTPPQTSGQGSGGIAPDFKNRGYQVRGVQQSSPVDKNNNWQYLQSMGVWKYGYAGQSRFNTWGFFYKLGKGHFDEHQRGRQRTHAGMDIMCKEGTPLLAPIDFHTTWAKMGIYNNSTQTGLRNVHHPLMTGFNRGGAKKEYSVWDVSAGKWTKVVDPATGKQKVATAATPITNIFFSGTVDASVGMGYALAYYYDHYLALKSPGHFGGYCPAPYASQQAGKLSVAGDGSTGLHVVCTGYYTPPRDKAELLGLPADTRLSITLDYIHMSRFAEHPNGKGIIGADNVGVVPANTVVGYVGNTGASASPHLHVNMWINTSKKESMSNVLAITAILKANADMLTAQLVAQITGFEPGANPNAALSSEMLNQEATAELKAKIRAAIHANKAYGNSALARADSAKTVGDLVKAFLADPGRSGKGGWTYGREFREYTTWSGTIWTNPMFFFLPEQLVNLRGVPGVTYRGGGGGSGPPGAPGGADPPLGNNSPAYNGNSLQWCSGLLGNNSRVAATAVAKDQKAAADAGKKTAADPKTKAAEDDKLKKTKEKNNAQVKASEAARKKAAAKPEPVRRKVTALARQSRRVVGGGSAPGAGVSANTGDKKK